MRGSRAKLLRQDRPDQPHPGRKSGGKLGLEPSAVARRERDRERMKILMSNNHKALKKLIGDNPWPPQTKTT